MTRSIGVFIGAATGAIYRNVPLTDATGENALPLRVGGLETWRLVHELDDPTGENWLENYLVFVPVAENVKLRPALTQITPLHGEALDGVYPVVRTVLAPRDTGLETNSIRLEINGQPAPALMGVDQDDTILTCAPVLTNSSTDFAASLVFQDNEGVSQTNHWNFSVRNADLALQLQAADRVQGVYALVSPINRDLVNQTIQAPLSAGTQFYRIQLAATAPCAFKLLSVRVEGQSVLFHYGF